MNENDYLLLDNFNISFRNKYDYISRHNHIDFL